MSDKEIPGNEEFNFDEAKFDGVEKDNIINLFGDNTNDDLNDDSIGDYENEGGATKDVDPAVVAFLDQQSAEHNNAKEAFQEHFGFVHDCRCDKDYSSGNMTEVTECFAQMAQDALDACAGMNAENKLLKGMISSAMGLAISEHFPNLEEGVDSGNTGEHPSEQGTQEPLFEDGLEGY